MDVDFNPAVAGVKSAEVSIPSDDPDTAEVLVSLSGEGVTTTPQEISASAASLDFGSAAVGSSQTLSVNISNIGDADLVIGALSITDITGSGFLFGAENCDGVVLLSGESCSIAIEFNPLTEEAFESTLVIPSNDPNTAQLNISLTGSSLAIDNGFGLNQIVEVDFGRAGTQSSGINNLTNVGGNLNGLLTSAQQTTTVNLNVTSNFNGTNNLGIAGNSIGIPGNASVDNFYGVAGNQATVVISNLDSDSLYELTLFASRTGDDNGSGRLTRYTVDGAGSQDLEAADNSADSVVYTNLAPAANGTITLDVEASPAGTANYFYLSYLSLQNLGSGGSSGEQNISADSASLDYGQVTVGTIATQTLTVSNDGDAELVISQLTITGTDSGDFTLFSDTCSDSSVPAGGSCTVEVDFNPALTGTKSAQLSIPSNDPDTSELLVGLTGEGAESVPQEINASVASLDFGNVTIGAIETLSVDISNQGDQDLLLGVLNIVDNLGSGFDFGSENCDSAILAPGESCSISIEFNPLAEASYDSDLVVLSDDPNTPELSIPLLGAGVTTGDSFDVGEMIEVDFGKTSDTTSSMNNITESILSVSNLTTTGDDNTGIAIAVVSDFLGRNSSGLASNQLGLPSSVSIDSFYGGSNNTHAEALGVVSTVEISNLEPGGEYALELFASRNGTDGSNGRLSRYTVNGVEFQDLDASDNVANTAQFTNVVADANGVITIDVEVSPDGSARYCYLGYLSIVRNL